MSSRTKVLFATLLMAFTANIVQTHAADLPACPTDLDAVWDSCIGVYEPKPTSEFSGDIYRGGFKADVFHGLGGYFYKNGEVFFGTYADGSLDGPGIYIYGPESGYSGDRFIGQFADGERNGHGAYFFADGDIFIGRFVNGLRDGPGTYRFNDGATRHGIWEAGKFSEDLTSPVSGQKDCPASPTAYFDECVGSFSFDDGDKYVGEFQDDDFHGLGAYYFPDGDMFYGTFRNGKWNGLGIYTFKGGDGSDGDLQIGWYSGGEIHGQGAYIFNTGGEWAGDIFAGNHKDGKSHGLGAYFHQNGDKFIGTYKDDVRHGPGAVYFANGEVKSGIWQDGDFQLAGAVLPDTGADRPDASARPAADTAADEVLSASSGSGFAVSEDGFVVTNNHVIDGCQDVYLHHEGQKFPATIVTTDPLNDLALLKADFAPGGVLPLAEARPELLQDIYVAGFPFGMGVSSTVKVTKGIISSLTGFGNNFSEVQIDAALQSGNSGGPIVDEAGNVIGVAVAKLDVEYALEKFGSIPENTNFGIKSSVVKSILDSYGVLTPVSNPAPLSKTDLGRRISRGTYYISCWMTMAQIEAMKSRKVMFDDLD